MRLRGFGQLPGVPGITIPELQLDTVNCQAGICVAKEEVLGQQLDEKHRSGMVVGALLGVVAGAVGYALLRRI